MNEPYTYICMKAERILFGRRKEPVRGGEEGQRKEED